MIKWEVWAAFSEVLCQPGDGTQATPVSVWQRATELLTNQCGRARRGHIDAVNENVAHSGATFKANAGCYNPGRFIEGHGDVSHFIEEHLPTADPYVQSTARRQPLHSSKTAPAAISTRRVPNQTLVISSQASLRQREPRRNPRHRLKRFCPKEDRSVVPVAKKKLTRVTSRDACAGRNLRPHTSLPGPPLVHAMTCTTGRPATTKPELSNNAPETTRPAAANIAQLAVETRACRDVGQGERDDRLRNEFPNDHGVEREPSEQQV